MSDIVFDGLDQITVLCSNLNIQGHDLLLDSPSRRKPNSPRFRRAMVHDQGDGLTLNFARDYPGGVTVSDVRTIEVTGDLRFRITHLDEILVGGGHPATENVSLADTIKDLRRQIRELNAKVVALTPKP